MSIETQQAQVSSDKVDMFIMTNQKYFPDNKIVHLKDKLLSLSESKFNMATTLEKKDPMILLLVSLFLGTLGVDRFMLGQVGLGILKLLTMGGFGIWTLIDWFMVMNKAREINYVKIMAQV